jgi:hypothetical protein
VGGRKMCDKASIRRPKQICCMVFDKDLNFEIVKPEELEESIKPIKTAGDLYLDNRR